MIQATLCFVFQGKPTQQILLGHKKRGFAHGKIDGFGGKLIPGEDMVQAAVRELEEETGLVAQPQELQTMGVLTFHFPFKPEWDQEVHVFIARRWQGVPAESEEMRPEWFPINAIPYDRMWDDSHRWMPHMLAGEVIRAVFSYAEDNETVDDFNIQLL